MKRMFICSALFFSLLGAVCVAQNVSYTVRVKTAPQSETGSNANGTDANVDIILTGSSGATDWIRLDNPKKNDFESGTDESLTVSAPDVGTLTSVTIKHDNTGNKPGWALEFIEVKKGSGSTVRFPCYRWLAGDEDDGATTRELAAGGAIVYHIRVTTANIKGAGTDANVRINLIGSDWSSYNRYLDSSVNDFEQGSVQTYDLTFRNLGALEDMTFNIGHDNAGKNADWCVSEVMILATFGQTEHLWRWTGEEWLKSGRLWMLKTLTREY